MKIVTANIPESYLDMINKIIGDNGLYPSRSELIRCAIREFLLKELKMVRDMEKNKEVELDEVFDDKNFVRVPVQKEEVILEYRCSVCFQKIEVKEDKYFCEDYFCKRCNDSNGSKIIMKLNGQKKIPSKEPVVEFKTYRILERLE